MKSILTILLSLFVQQLFAQSPPTIRAVRDSIVYDLMFATRAGSPGGFLYFGSNITDDGRITRAVADFNGDSTGGHGWKLFINWQEEFTLKTDSAVTFYDPSGSRDTVDIYLFDKDHAPFWDTIVNTHNYTPNYHIVSCGSCAGIPVNTVLTSPAGVKVQYALIVLHRTNLFSGLWPDIRKINFRGTLTGNKDTVYNMADWAGQSWTAMPIDSIIGNFNLQNQQDTLWHDTATKQSVAGYGYFRSFDQNFFDDEVQPFPNNRMNLGGAGYTAYKYNAALARRGNYQFAVFYNNNPWYKHQLDSIGHNSTVRGWGTTSLTDDPQQPASYKRKGRYMHGQVWIGGNCPTCPGVPTYNGTAVPGQNYMKGVGVNNEAGLFAFADAYKTGIMNAAEAIGVVDSAKLGDPNMKVFINASEAYVYDQIKSEIILMKLWYRSRNIHVDGAAIHSIHTLKTDSFPVIPTSNQQIGNHGVSVGYWSDWQKDIHIVQWIRREVGNPNFLVQNDEDTHQKGVYKRKPLDVGETFSVSQLGTPRFTVGGVTLDAYNSHGVAVSQDLFIATATPFYKHYWYTLVDEILKTTNPDYDAIDGNNGWYDKPATCCTETPEAHPAAMIASSILNSFGRYQFVDSIVKIPRGLHVFKYQHMTVANRYLFLYAVLDSSSTASFDLTSLIGLPLLSGTIVTPSFVSRTSTTASGSTNSLSADPLLRGFIVDIPAGPAAPSQGIRIRARIKQN